MTTASYSLRLSEIVSSLKQDHRYIRTLHGFNICRRCCSTQRSKFALDSLWFAETDRINRVDTIKCDNCGNLIPKFSILSIKR